MAKKREKKTANILKVQDEFKEKIANAIKTKESYKSRITHLQKTGEVVPFQEINSLTVGGHTLTGAIEAYRNCLDVMERYK